MNSHDWIAFAALAFTVMCTLGGMTFGAVLWAIRATRWIAEEFRATRHAVYDKVDQTTAVVVEKLEYHERHDDDRFKAINDQLTAIQVSNAARDAKLALGH